MTKCANHKPTIKQETFCHAYVETGNASEAYRRTYGCSKWKEKSVWEKASTLLANVKVQSRVDQLRGQIRERHKLTVDDIVAELEEARAVALKNDTASAMVAASVAKAKLLGLVIDKNEITGKDGRPLHPSQIEPTTRDLARAILDVLREANIEEQDTANGQKRANTADENKADVYKLDPRSRKLGAA